MIQVVADPLRAVHELFESLLMSYSYDHAAGVFELVTDYYARAPGSDRAFIRFRFSGVADFRRHAGLYAPLQRFVEQFSLAGVRATSVVQKVELDTESEPARARLGFGTSFGEVSFTYRELVADSRSARVTTAGSSTPKYFDFDDGTPFEFDAPFA